MKGLECITLSDSGHLAYRRVGRGEGGGVLAHTVRTHGAAQGSLYTLPGCETPHRGPGEGSVPLKHW